MNTDELIKDAFGWQADRAPGPHRVLAALRTARQEPQRPRRRRHAGLALAAAGVVAAVVVPIAVLGGGDAAEQGPTGAGPDPATPTAQMRYRPNWLPEGFLEQSRTHSDTAQGRSWAGPDAADPNYTPSVALALSSDTELPRTNGIEPTQPITINGAEGVLWFRGDRDLQAIAYWLPKPGERLEVHIYQLPNAKELAVRIAESVVPDGTSTFASAASFGWLPTPWRPARETVAGTSPTDWSAGLSAARTDGQTDTAYTLHAEISRANPATGDDGSPVRVRGRTGQYFDKSKDDDIRGELVVQLEDNRWLSVSCTRCQAGPVEVADLVRIADTLTIHPDLPQPWIGTR